MSDEPQDTGALVLACASDGEGEEIWARNALGLWVCLCGCGMTRRWQELTVIGEAIPPLPRRLWRLRR